MGLRDRFVDTSTAQMKLSQRLLTLQDSCDVDVKNSDSFKWHVSQETLQRLLGEDGYCTSGIFKCTSDAAKFYAQLNVMDEQVGRVTLILYKLKGGAKEKTVSFDLHCKALSNFYARLHDITFRLDGEAEETRQGADFKLATLRRALEKGKELEWKITIGD